MLKYNKKGFIAGIPARDLADDEVAKYGRARLMESGLYDEIEEKKQKSKRESVKRSAEAEEVQND